VNSRERFLTGLGLWHLDRDLADEAAIIPAGNRSLEVCTIGTYGSRTSAEAEWRTRLLPPVAG
jgi:hypothetical protein